MKLWIDDHPEVVRQCGDFREPPRHPGLLVKVHPAQGRFDPAESKVEDAQKVETRNVYRNPAGTTTEAMSL